jgi:nucleotide sugar dehydrogenase
MTTIGIFGMGYVGSEVAELAVQRGYDLYVSDIDPDVIEQLRDGTHAATVPPDAVTATTDGARVVSVADIIVIAVPTPLDSSYSVDLSALESVAATIGEALNPDRIDQLLVAVESTIPPGTTENIVVPTLTETGPVVGEDLYIAHAPERITPGSGHRVS